MIKTYTSTVKAEVFDGSDEMIEKYHIRTNTVYSLDPENELSNEAISYQIETLDQIETIEGWIVLEANDWIATGVDGEHWAIKDDIFKKTYTEVK